MEIKERTVQIVAAALLAAALGLIYLARPTFFADFWRVATSGNLQDTVDYIASFGAWAMVFSFVFDVLINALGFLPSIFVSTANGLLFGVVPGVIISWLAETVGVVISFLLMRTVLRAAAEAVIANSNYLQKVDEISGRDGFRIMLVLRTIPYFPSGLLTALGAVSRISVRDYVLANLIGKFPSTALEVVIGHDAVRFEENLARLTFVVIAVTIVYGYLWWRERKKEKHKDNAD